MKYFLQATLLLCLLQTSANAQSNYFIKGSVNDKEAQVPLLLTSVSVLHAKDSTLVKFTRANAAGAFEINDLKPGKFILLMTYPKYADFVESFTLDSSKRSIDFGEIHMLPKSKLLADVIIKGQVAAIKIKGDTTEYNAGSFKIEPNSKVEDLLRQLPGIQVDRDGKITAQGETVSKVLVDGEEFFGDDPTLVTKNIRGDMVDKVQLYDKKSDQATFTGIDDGVKTKTINIKLKEDKKKGYFGKADIGGANDEFYQGQGMFNAFKATKKFALYGTAANTGKTGLSWQDSNKYGVAGNAEFTDDGGIMISGGRDELNYNGQGIPSAQTGGVHYDGKWGKDKESINVNYKIGRLSIDGVRSNLDQTTLPTGLFNSNNAQRFNNSTFRQKFDATYQLKIDTTSNLKLVVEGGSRISSSSTISNALSTRENNVKWNASSRNSTNDGSGQSFFASAFYNKKLKKKGRTYSILLSERYSQDDDEGFLIADIDYYNRSTGLIDSSRVTNQLKTNDARNSTFTSNVTYTEPLTKSFSLVLNYGLSLASSTSDKRSFNQNLAGRYEDLDSVFSNNFELDRISNEGGAIVNYKKGKTVFNFGAKLIGVQFDQFDVYRKKNYERNFINLNPQARYQYNFSQQKSIAINYNGSTTQPTINQIQPIRNNTDPLNIFLGNGNLKPSFRNSISFNSHNYKVLSKQYFYTYGYYSFTINPIVSSTFTASGGSSTYQSVNLTNRMATSFQFSGFFGREVKALGADVGLELSARGNTNYNYISTESNRDVLNKLQSNDYSGELSIRKNVEKKYRFRVSFGPTYSVFESSVQTAINNNSGGFLSNGGFTIYLPGKFEINSDYRYTLTGRTETFNEDVDFFIWNTSFSKKFLKKENLRLSLSGNDLLNQNIGFRRNAYGTSVSQNSFTTIRRYFLCSLIYDFNKMGGGIKPNN
jgi:hypothetical protein